MFLAAELNNGMVQARHHVQRGGQVAPDGVEVWADATNTGKATCAWLKDANVPFPRIKRF